jgi:O-antigen ligase
MQEITKRWQADMESDSWASKNIRPYATAGTLVFTFIVMILDSAIKSFKVEDHWVNLLVTLLSLMVVALFGSRGYEKIKGVAGKVKGK